MLGDWFLNPAGLWALLFLIPFIILYLIKPKPMKEKIPSLMFILKDAGKNRLNAFFKTFTKDLLLLIQLIILLLLIFSVMKPYIKVSRSDLVEESVIIIDQSASMKADGRFDKAISEALNGLGKTNTIISVRGTPKVLAEKVSPSKAEDLLNSLEPLDTTTNLQEAFRLATKYSGIGVKVGVYSDFKRSEGADYEPVAAEIKSKGALLDYHLIGSQEPNVGFIDMKLIDDKGSLWVKNFNQEPVKGTITIGKTKTEITLDKLETREVEFKAPPGITEITLSVPKKYDSLSVDDKVLVSTPTKNEVRILVITNEKDSFENSNFKLACDLISKNYPVNIKFYYAIPPKMPDFNHDIYLFYKVNPNYILPGVIKEISKKVSEEGAAAIIFSQPKLFSINFNKFGTLLPATYLGTGNRESINKEINLLTKNIEFGQVTAYYRVKPGENAITLAKAGDDPIIILGKNGKGATLYYGIEDDKGSFRKDPSYPVFWRRIIDFLTKRPDVKMLNIRTGTLISLPRVETIITPSGEKIKTSIIRAEEAGLYQLPDRTIAANLLSEQESDLTIKNPEDLVQTVEKLKKEQEEKVPLDLSEYLLIIAIIMMIAEILYLKLRGDL